MAMITEPLESHKDVNDRENDTTNGDTSLILNYSGQSEELHEERANQANADGKICDDYDDHNVVVPIAKVVDAHGFSDDELPKTLTTLETVKKTQANKESDDEDEICPIETADDDDEDEEEPVLLEVTDGDDELVDDTTINSNVHSRPSVANGEANAHLDDVNVTPIKPIPTPSAGTIEIPRELITSEEVETPIIINHLKTTSENGDDLIAILEGDDNGALSLTSSVEHYEFSLAKANGEGLSKEQEREIAMEQMLNLPKKKKGRPRTKEPIAKPAAKPAANQRNQAKKSDELVNSLVSDWDDGEAKANDRAETEIFVEISIPQEKKRKMAEPAEPTIRRSRIIKKKIIWDPDAPETAINYASLVQTSGPGKKPRKQTAKRSESECATTDDNTSDAIDATISTAPKKKKTSEIDKLLGDEGAINMLNSLNQSNSSGGGDGPSPGKMPRVKQVKSETPTGSPSTSKTKAAKAKEIKETAVQKQPPIANRAKSSTPKSSTANKKRNAKDTNETWDYIYNERPDDCMIFRRRSNSSYSSTASLNRNSLDLPNAPSYDFDSMDDNAPPTIQPQSKRARGHKEKTFEFAKPKARKSGKGDRQTKIQNFFDAKPTDEDVDNVFNNNGFYANSIGVVPIKVEVDANLNSTFATLTVTRYEHFNQIILISQDNGADLLLTVQMMKEIETALHTFENEKNCKLVLLTTDNGRFCSNIDRSSLMQTTADKRRASANDLSKKISNFVQVLATFRKPLLTSVQGDINGFGLRLLPLFDIVYTSDNTIFNTAHDNETIEGCAIISATDRLNYNTKTKLLLHNEKLTAKMAEECNIVSHVLEGSAIDQFVLIECEKLAQKSPMAIETFKLIQQQTMLPKLKDALKIEQKQLSIVWTKSDGNLLKNQN